MKPQSDSFAGLQIQDSPPILCVAIPGQWLLERTTPSWRIDDPHEGFQRMVNERRAREIALAVLDQDRSFPNAIVLATDSHSIDVRSGQVSIPTDVKFLIVDGQHRLWAQKFSDFPALYACMIHTGLSVKDMADLFLEINDNQKRVPSSLRWDLVRLVRSDDDPEGAAASEIVYLLTTDRGSPFFQRIDLTGEQSELTIKQGSLAPEFRGLLSRRSSPLRGYGFQQQYDFIMEYCIAIKQIDADDWGRQESIFFKARVLRAMLRLLPEIFKEIGDSRWKAMSIVPYLERIDRDALDPERIRSAQGSAGIRAIYLTIRGQVFSV